MRFFLFYYYWTKVFLFFFLFYIIITQKYTEYYLIVYDITKSVLVNKWTTRLHVYGVFNGIQYINDHDSCFLRILPLLKSLPIYCYRYNNSPTTQIRSDKWLYLASDTNTYTPHTQNTNIHTQTYIHIHILFKYIWYISVTRVFKGQTHLQYSIVFDHIQVCVYMYNLIRVIINF